MKINWLVRVKNKNFWIAIIPAVLLIIQPVLALCGVTIDPTTIGAKLLAIVDAVFVVLTILGVVVDPTTAGMSDSDLALTYTTPKKSNK